MRPRQWIPVTWLVLWIVLSYVIYGLTGKAPISIMGALVAAVVAGGIVALVWYRKHRAPQNMDRSPLG